VFWRRTSREARRQEVLDELLELDQGQRQARLELAVAAGQVRPDEVEETLRLVHRLEGLSVMTFHPWSQRASGEAPAEAVDILAGPCKPSAVAQATGTVATAFATIPVVTDQEPGRSLPDSAAGPLEAVMAPGWLIGGELAARRVRVGSYSSRQRRLRLLAAGSGSSSEAASLSGGNLDPYAGEDAVEPAWPDISWLRP
jgi:hypothetical protein